MSLNCAANLWTLHKREGKINKMKRILRRVAGFIRRSTPIIIFVRTSQRPTAIVPIGKKAPSTAIREAHKACWVIIIIVRSQGRVSAHCTALHRTLVGWGFNWPHGILEQLPSANNDLSSKLMGTPKCWRNKRRRYTCRNNCNTRQHVRNVALIGFLLLRYFL